MKKIIDFILAVAMAVGLYMPCREIAVMERGYTDAIGGEALVPVLVLIGYVIFADAFKEEAEE